MTLNLSRVFLDCELRLRTAGDGVDRLEKSPIRMTSGAHLSPEIQPFNYVYLVADPSASFRSMRRWTRRPVAIPAVLSPAYQWIGPMRFRLRQQ